MRARRTQLVGRPREIGLIRGAHGARQKREFARVIDSMTHGPTVDGAERNRPELREPVVREIAPRVDHRRLDDIESRCDHLVRNRPAVFDQPRDEKVGGFRPPVTPIDPGCYFPKAASSSSLRAAPTISAAQATPSRKTAISGSVMSSSAFAAE